MKKHYSSHQCYQTMAASRSMAGSRFPYPVFVKQKTTWMRFLLFCLYGRGDTAVAALQPIRVTHNHRFHPYR
ncbi:MAG: hypothetical protein H6667_17290 [Ardenticatenaceae bacterium]|nr:hypothetical protein [Ardenticatenaceae bacterium]MCB9443208.1 hypothetical protein [Ardenticatenaceae bacterium]